MTRRRPPSQRPRRTHVQTIGVVGLGTMGAGIAEVFARNGYAVIGVEQNDEGLGAAASTSSTPRAGRCKREKMTEDEQAELLGRITFTTELKDLTDADFVVEAVVESLEVKKSIFRELDAIVSPGGDPGDQHLVAVGHRDLHRQLAPGPGHRRALLQPGAGAEPRRDRPHGRHRGPGARRRAARWCASSARTRSSAATRPASSPTRCCSATSTTRSSMYEDHYASREDIDAAMRFGCGYPMGPLALLDLIGLDTAYEILDTMYRQGRDRLHAPAPILKQMVTAGMLGRKTGRGFYTYEGPDSPVVVADDQTPSADDKPQLRHDITRVGVVGTGTMATGIVEVFAKAGYDVAVRRSLARTRSTGCVAAIEQNFDKAIQRGKPPRSRRRPRCSAGSPAPPSLDDLNDVDLVVEAIAEDLAVKTTLFANLDEICKPGAILATTTSSLPIISLAKVTSRPQDVIGMHFFNPAPVMKLVEVVSTVVDRRGRHRDHPGAVRRGRQGRRSPAPTGPASSSTRCCSPTSTTRCKMLEAHYATADDIDTAMKQGCALPMGPFELLDVVGNDVSLAIQRELYLEFREPGFAPAPLLEHLVTAGYLGRKTKRGFRDYIGSLRQPGSAPQQASA